MRFGWSDFGGRLSGELFGEGGLEEKMMLTKMTKKILKNEK